MLNKFKPRYKTNKKIVDWEPTPDSKSRTRDRDKAKAGQGGDFWVKSLSDGRVTMASLDTNIYPSSIPCDIVVNEDGDTFHLFRQYKSSASQRSSYDDPTDAPIANSASDFCITKINANGDKVWEKIYAYPSHKEDGAGLYMSNPDHDGTTAQEWDEIFSYRIPKTFAGDDDDFRLQRFHINSFVHAEGYLYTCAHVNGDGTQLIYPENFISGIYVIKIDASTGEVVDDSYVHLSETNYSAEEANLGLDFAKYSYTGSSGTGTSDYSTPIFNYDPYQNKIIVLSKLSLKWIDNGNEITSSSIHRNIWGTVVTEIDADTMEPTVRYLNYQVQNYVDWNQAKNMIAFSPTHNYVVGRTMRGLHPDRLDIDGDTLAVMEDTALFQFDKEWNLVNKKQYGYPEKDDQGNYFHTAQDWAGKTFQNGYGQKLTQGYWSQQVCQIFYSESKDKIYTRNNWNALGDNIVPINEYSHGKEFVDNVSGDLDLSYNHAFRITEIEPSDLSIVSVKWPEWKGSAGENQFPQSTSYDSGWLGTGFWNGLPMSMSLDGKYLYSVLRNVNFASGSHPDDLQDGANQHHYFTAPWYQQYKDMVPNFDILRYNIETGEFDRSWCVASRIWAMHNDGTSSYSRTVDHPSQIVATSNGWVASFQNAAAGGPGSGAELQFSLTVGSKNADASKSEAWIGLTDTSRLDLDVPSYEGAMVYQNTEDDISTWTETPGWMTANERFMWDQPEGWGVSKSREGTDFYTYYNSQQTLTERQEFLDQYTYFHKIADLIGERHEAYDQDGWVDTVFDVDRIDPGAGPYLFKVTSYEKPFYRGASEGPIKGGDGGFNDMVEVPKSFLAFIQRGYNIDINDRFSGSGLLPPLPETDHHVFYSLNPNMSWLDMPTFDEDNGTLERVDSTTSGIINFDFQGGSLQDTFTTEPPFTHNTQTVYRYRAIFDWDGDGTTIRDEGSRIISIERFGLNSITGKRNQISSGAYAFYWVVPMGKDLMHYHGSPLLLRTKDHMWDMGGPGFRTLDTSNLTDMSYMFNRYGALPVSGPTLSTWDTSNVTDMSYMFKPVRTNNDMRLTIELRWDTSSVTNMEGMFPTQSFVDARTWDFSNVVNIENFASEESLILIDPNATVPEIASWGDRKFECRDVQGYLQRCWPGLTNYSILGYEDCAYWLPSSYTIMIANREITDDDLPMYGSANVPSDTELELIDQYETSTRATRYVYKAAFPWNNATNEALRQPVSLDWLEDVTQFGGNRLEDGRNAFSNASITTVTGFSGPKFTVSNLTNFDSMFSGCSNFNGNVTGWDTSNATSMASMFSGCAEFNNDITGWDVSNVEYMDSMFSGCSNFNQDISGWNTQNVISADSQFSQASSFNQDLSEWCVRGFASEPTDFSTGASSWTQPHPVWGTCPRNEDGLGQDYFHIFIANGNDIRFPISSDSDVRSVYVDEVLKDYATEVKGKIFNGSTIKAEFDWDNIGSWSLDWIDQIVQFGLNSETGKYNQIKSGLRAFYFGDFSNSDAVNNLDVSNLTDCTSMFNGNGSAVTFDLSGWDTSNFTDLERCFSSASCNVVGLENWDVSNVTSMRSFASSASLFNADIGGWDVSGVSDFNSAFYNATSFSQDLSGWNTSGATNMYGMFQQASNFNSDIGGWDVSNVTNMSYMFRDATSFNQDLSLWCVPLISSEPNYFSLGATSWTLPKPFWGICPALITTFVTNTPTLTWDMLPTNDADNGSLTLISDNGDGTWTFEVDAFYDNSVVQRDLSWMLDVVTFKNDTWNNQAYSFNGSPATSITVLNKANIASAIKGADLSYTFANMPNFNQDISGWDVSATTNMNGMFSGATSFNRDLSRWNTVAVTSMEDMFNGATSFNQDLSPWCVGLIASEPSGFSTGATSWTLDQPVWGTCPRNEDGSAPDEFYHIFVANSNSINFPVPSDDLVGYCFVDGVQKDYITEIKGKVFSGSTIKASFDWDNELSNNYNVLLTWIQDLVQIGFNTETMSYNQIKNSRYAFYRMDQVVQSDAMANLDTSNLTDLHNTLNRCYNFNTDISGWDTSNVTSMQSTFVNCYRFDQPIGSWNTSNVTNLNSTFYGADDFNQDISGWDVSSVTDMASTFSQTDSFNQDISSWNVGNATTMNYMFNRAIAFNQDLSSWCVGLIESAPLYFDYQVTGWTLPRPVWGTCPRPVTEFVSNTNALDWSMLPTNDPDDGSLVLTNDNGDGTYLYEAAFLYDNSVVQKNLSWLLDVLIAKDNSLVPSYAFNGSPATSISLFNNTYVLVGDASHMFANMPNFNQNLAAWDVSAVTNTSHMFSGASNFNSDISAWSTTAVTNMSYMFSGAASFNSDISGWDTTFTTNMDGMFNNAASFNQNLSSKWCVSQFAIEPTLFSDGATSWLEENKPTWGFCPTPTLVSRIRLEGDLVGPNEQYASSADAQADGWTIEGGVGDDTSGGMTVPLNIQGVDFFGTTMPSTLYNGTNGNLTLPTGSGAGRSGNFVGASTNSDLWISHWNQDTYTLAQMHKVVGNEWVVRSEYKIPWNGVFGCVVETTFKPDGSVKIVYGTVVSSTTITIGTTKQGVASRGEAIYEGFGDAANSLGDFVWAYNAPE